MPIAAADLADIVERASRRAASEEQDAAWRAAAAIRQAGTGAHEGSDTSIHLMRVIEAGQGILEPAALERLARVRLLGVASDYANAIPLASGDERRILVFDGLKHQIAYAIDLLKVLDVLQSQRPDATFDDNGETMPEALAFSVAGFAVLADAVTHHRPPAAVADLLGPIARMDARNAFQLAVLFTVLHELGHIELDHLGLDGIRSERQEVHLVVPETLSAYQLDELAADAFAVAQFRPEYRAELMPSLIFFFLPFVFIEGFAGGRSAHHPLAMNRLAALEAVIEMPPDMRSIVTDWIAARLANVNDLADSRRAHGGDLRPRMQARMPIERAYQILREIKARVFAESGVLDTPRELTLAESRYILRNS